MRDSDAINLNVSIVKPYTKTKPIRFRKYNFYHKEDENTIDLVIGPEFINLELGTISTDIIYGQWYWFVDNMYHLTLFAFVGDYPYNIAKERYNQFLDELPLASASIIKGDREFFMANEQLLDSIVLVRFISTHPEFNKTVPYFRISDFDMLHK